MAMLPSQKVSRCDYVVFMISNRHTELGSETAMPPLQDTTGFTQHFVQGWVQVLWYWTQTLFIVWWETPSSSPAQLAQRLPRQPALTQMKNGKREFESCRTCGWMRKFLHSPWRNVSPVCAIFRNRRLSLTPVIIPHCYQSSMSFSPSYAQTNWGAPTSARQRLKLLQQLSLATHQGGFCSEKGTESALWKVLPPHPHTPQSFLNTATGIF